MDTLQDIKEYYKEYKDTQNYMFYHLFFKIYELEQMVKEGLIEEETACETIHTYVFQEMRKWEKHMEDIDKKHFGDNNGSGEEDIISKLLGL